MENELAQLLSGGAIARKINVTLYYNEVEKDKENLWSLLYMAGFLTKASEEQTRLSGLVPNPDKDEMALVIPNREIHKIFAMEVTNWFWDIGGGQEEEKGSGGKVVCDEPVNRCLATTSLSHLHWLY